MFLNLLENKKLIAAFLIIFGFILLGERLWFYKKVRQKLIKPYAEGSFLKIEPNRPLIIKDLPAFQLDGELNEWKGVPFSLRLSADENQNIQVMLAKTPQGLALGFQFSGSAEGLARKLSEDDKLFFYLRLKLTEPRFPPIGLGNQFGYCLLKEGQSEAPFKCEQDPQSDGSGACALNSLESCEEWYQAQQVYRRELKKLFERQWIISLKESQEIRATESWRQLSQMKSFSEKASEVTTEVIKLLNPANQPALQVREYLPRSFEVLVPWNALPPADQLKLENLSLTLSLEKSPALSSKVAESSSAASENEPQHFLTGSFEIPKEFTLTPCRYPLESEDKYDKKIPAYFFPTEELQLQSTWSLVNLVRGYLDFFEGVSPIVQENHYLAQKVGEKEFVCGPDLSYRKNDEVIRYDCPPDSPLKQDEKICPPRVNQKLQAKRLSNGMIRVQAGPWLTTHSKFGSGSCGGAPYYGIEIYVIDLQQKLHLAFNHDHAVCMDSGDLNILEEGDQIVVAESKWIKKGSSSDSDIREEWTETTYCWDLNTLSYPQCKAPHPIEEPKDAIWQREDKN